MALFNCGFEPHKGKTAFLFYNSNNSEIKVMSGDLVEQIKGFSEDGFTMKDSVANVDKA